MNFSSQYIFTTFPNSPSSKSLKNLSQLAKQLESTTGLKTKTTTHSEQTSIPLKKMLSVMLKAAKNNAAWVQDFNEEQITISCDLFEVMQKVDELDLKKQPNQVSFSSNTNN